MSERSQVNAAAVCHKAASLVGGERAKSHGDVYNTHAAVAALWSAYLGARGGDGLGPLDVALMMALLKVARTTRGTANLDDFVDIAGYAGCAGEIAARDGALLEPGGAG